MKKLISLSLVLIILLGILAVPAAADESQITVGSLAYLTITEEQDQSLGASARRPLTMLL